MADWSANGKHNLHFNCNKKVQDKTKAPKAPIDKDKGVQTHRHVRCVLMMVKVRRCTSLEDQYQ